MFVSWECCVLCRYRLLRRADHSFRGVLSSECEYVCVFGCVCFCLWSRNLKRGKRRPELGSCAARKKYFFTNVLIQGSLLRPCFVPEKVDVSPKRPKSKLIFQFKKKILD
jgi:hypothetical protein